MTRLRIEYNRNGCIGAFACMAIDPDMWEQADDGKANLVGGKESGEVWVLELDTDDVDKIVDAANSCPVTIIKVTNLETGEVLVG